MERAASEFLRALRGNRSQVQLARRLGYRGNPITDWERGERFPTAEEAMRVATLCGIDVPAAFRRFSRAVALRGAPCAAELARWLSELRGTTSQIELAARCGHSRFAVARWLSGKAQPRLPDFFRLVDAASGRLPEWAAELVPIERVPSLHQRFLADAAAKDLAFELPWTEAVLRVLETRSYEALRRHRPGFLADCLGISVEDEAICLARLEAAGLIERRGQRYAVRGGRNVDTQGGKKALHRLKQHWSNVATLRLDAPRSEDVFAYNVMSLNRADLERVRHKLRALFREVRVLVAASEPEEVAALLNVHLVTFDPERANGLGG